MKRIWFVLAVLAAWAVCLAPGQVTTQPAARQSTSAAVSRPAASRPAGADFEQLRSDGLKALLRGRFRDGLKLLDKAAAIRPDDVVAKACELTVGYLEVLDKADSERRAEYVAAVRRVRLASLARKHQDELVAAKLIRKPDEANADSSEDDSANNNGPIFTGVEGVADAVVAVDKLLSARPTSQPADLRGTALKHLDEAARGLSEMARHARKGPPEWRRVFRQTVDKCRRAMEACRRAWAQAELPADRQTLKAAAEPIRDALIDMGVLISRDPLLVALIHAREARELSENKEEFFKEAWVVALIAEAEKRGTELIAEGQWGEALSIYGRSGLGDVDADNVTYQEMAKRISQHVRVIRLYGNDGKQPTTTSAPTEMPRWREMIQSIDAKMVQNAISQVDGNYVETPDYRKIGIGALEGVKVLAETSQVTETFGSLADSKKLQAFLHGLNGQIEQIRTDPLVDHITVIQALRRTLDLNDDTVELPPEVINMEFADSMVGKLDKFSSVIWPYEMADFHKRTMGKFFGIGVQIRQEPGAPIEVVTPLADTPAFRAGIRAGDWIVRVDGKEAKKLSINTAVKLIMGPRHTKVTLTIRRSGVPKPFDVEITRDEIHIRTIKGWRRRPDGQWDYLIDPDAGIGYIRLTQFTADTAGDGTSKGDLQKALDQMRRDGAEALILDMRFNPGGLLESAEKAANEFLRRGLIVRTKGRNAPGSKRKHTANALGGFLDGKMVVLVNQFSASAAEIVAGALKDWGRATIVGERTYGKGSVQRLIPINKGGTARLKLTTAYYYLPSGTCLHRTNGAKTWGVGPDLRVPVTIRQTNRWAEIRQETELLKSIDADRLNMLMGHQLREDLQLQTALLLLRMGRLAQQS